MKRFLIAFLIALSFSSCYVYEQVRVSSTPQSRFYWDPIYGYPHYYYRAPQTVIIVPRREPRVYVKPEPRRSTFGPTAPPSAPRPRSSQAPIRTFPKRNNEK
jgi:hypothetical protein